MTHLIESESRHGCQWLMLNRPEKRNALNPPLIRALADAVDEAAANDRVRALVVYGAGGYFCSGIDLSEPLPDKLKDLYLREIGPRDALARCRKPVVAVVEGGAIGGGCELALSADILFAAEGAEFGQPEIRYGGIPGAGATQRLVRAAGRLRAMELLLSGRMFDAQEAYRLGLASQVLPNSMLMSAVEDFARKLGEYPVHLPMMMKEAIGAAEAGGIEAGLAQERLLAYMSLAATQESGADD